MPRTCVLLGGPVRNNTRFSNLCHALARLGPVDIFYTVAHPDDRSLYPSAFRLFHLEPPTGARPWLLRHSLFTREYEFLGDEALRRPDAYSLVFADNLPTLRPAVRVARRHGARLLYSAEEIWVETLTQFFPRSAEWPKAWAFRVLPRLMRRLGRAEERRLWPSIDLLITPNASYGRYLKSQYGDCREVVVLSCPRLGSYGRTNRLREVLGLSSSSKIVLYQGALNHGRHLEMLIESAAWLPDDVVIVFLGSGHLETDMRSLIAARGLEKKVRMVPAVPYSELFAYTASADIGVLLLEANNLSKHLALANKVFEYMAAGLPLLVSDSPEQAAVVRATESGVVVSSSSPQALARDIQAMCSDPAGLATMGSNGRRAFESKHNWEMQEERFLKEVGKLLAPSHASSDVMPFSAPMLVE